MGTWENLLSWIVQTVLIASVGALLPILFRIRHPRTQLGWCHFVLAACLLVPLAEPWRHPLLVRERDQGAASTVSGQAGDLAGEPGRGPSRLPHATGDSFARGVQPAPAAAAEPPSVWRTAWGNRLLWLGWVLAAGAAARFGWLLTGLFQIRKYRIGATPLYPFPESVKAASALTHADAVFCLSPDAPGPVMLGWLAPVVLLPESFLTLGEEAQCGIACHELLHVRRHDWPVTLLEEVAGALLWFNPAVWWLLSQTRLAREQVVDAEAVRLTAAREPYIEALLAIARQRPLLDLAPAPLFLRRRHLTQRMHSLLKEVSMSKLRLLSSYCSITVMLVCAGWLACLNFPLTGQPHVQETPQGTDSVPRQAEVAVAASPDAAPAPIDAVTPAVHPQDAPTRPAAGVPEAGSRVQDHQGDVKKEPVIVALQLPQRVNRAGATGTRLASAPVPADPHEPVIGGVQTPATPEARATALSLLEFARENGQTHRAGTSPYIIKATFNATGNSVDGGSGELTETWLSGQVWRWTASLGSYSVARSLAYETVVGEKHPGVVPMRVHMLRNAVFWALQQVPSSSQVRTAAIQWNGKAATCILTSRMVAPPEETRLWEEEEYCVDNASKLLQVQSVAPGTYVVYGYSGNAQFHGRSTPSRITIYVAGATVLDAQLSITDAGSVDPSQLLPTPEMIAKGPAATLALPMRFPLEVSNASVSGTAKPVIVHASTDTEGNVVEEELSSAADPALAQAALDLVRNTKFPQAGVQRQLYINVRYVPVSQ
jgi:hypothetical protein